MSEKSAPSYQEQWMIGSNLNDDGDDEYRHYHDHCFSDNDEGDDHTYE